MAISKSANTYNRQNWEESVSYFKFLEINDLDSISQTISYFPKPWSFIFPYRIFYILMTQPHFFLILSNIT